MKHLNNKYLLLIFSLFFLIFTVSAQDSDELWSKVTQFEKSNAKKNFILTAPNKYEKFHLNLDLLKSKLNNSPIRKGKLGKSNTILNFPNSIGKLERYEIFEASIMDEELQKKHPNIKSYIGKGIDNPSSIIRFSVTSMGLHAMILKNDESTVFVDPDINDKKSYLVYAKSDVKVVEPFQCKFDEYNKVFSESSANTSAKAENANDGNLRTFRLAVATTGEYSQFHLTNQSISGLASDADKKAAVLSAIVVTMTRVNAIFERDVALTMELVNNNTKIIFLDAATDGFTNNDGSILIDESQTIIDRDIGTASYDIGHTFSTGGGGLAQINSPCTVQKARGITGASSPIGDSYNIDYVAHEMGHQFGAHHTFNSGVGNCAPPNRNDATAVEPGSGSTIMAYAGICAPENVQPLSDDYFHLVSIREIWKNISVGSSTCGVITSTSNSVPTVNSIPNYTIPKSTPFILDATASDVDGNALTYTWEQLDTEIAIYPLVSTAIDGPAFRSVGPSSSSKRYFPNIETVIAGELSNTWEVLSSVSRTMRFGVNVRDNNVSSSAGQTVSAETLITVDASSGPFKVTSQDVAVTWDAGTSQTVNWDVANTNEVPINCEFVNILLSTDGGYTYGLLASNVANDGSQDIIVPNNSTPKARIKVEGVGNIFYAINSATITIQASEFIMTFDAYVKSLCAPVNAVYNFTHETFLGFNEEIVFSASGNPPGTTVVFNPASATSNGTPVDVTINGIGVEDIGKYNITINGNSTTTAVSKSTVVELNIYSATISSPVLVLPVDNSTNILKPYELSWVQDVNATDYNIEIASDLAFSSIVEAGTSKTAKYFPQLLQPNTIYYWRVQGINSCGGIGTFSSIFNFKTENESCDTYTSIDTPINIPDNDTSGISSKINVTQNKLITDLNVTVNITHPWIGDLDLKLISPYGVSVQLVTGREDDGDNYMNTIFDNDAPDTILSGVAPYTGLFRPQGDLSVLNGLESYGSWTLEVIDGGPEDIGTINNWSIEVCGIPVISDDDDKDGVLNVDDLCPLTVLGTTVDATGCPIFSLPADNFTIETIGETCPDKNNGQLIITAKETHSYVANINGVDYNFVGNELNLNDLNTGSYDVCITVTGESYKQCYTLVIEQGTTVSAKSSVASNKISITIEQGTAPYIVLVNGVEVLVTNNSSFSIDIKQGDLVQVKTNVVCEGIYSKKINLFEQILAYPNPTKGKFDIALPVSQKEVLVELYTIHGQLISIEVYNGNSGKLQLSLENKSTGLYFVKIHLEKPVLIKIIKQ